MTNPTRPQRVSHVPLSRAEKIELWGWFLSACIVVLALAYEGAFFS